MHCEEGVPSHALSSTSAIRWCLTVRDRDIRRPTEGSICFSTSGEIDRRLGELDNSIMVEHLEMIKLSGNGELQVPAEIIPNIFKTTCSALTLDGHNTSYALEQESFFIYGK